MSMMIQKTFEVGPSAASPGQPLTISDEQASDKTPSFFEVLTKSLLADAGVASKKVVKAPVNGRHQGKEAADDKADPAALLTGMNLLIIKPERKPGHTITGAATALKEDLNVLTRGAPLLLATATDRALIAVNNTAQEAAGFGPKLAEALPAAGQSDQKGALAALAGEGEASAAMTAKELPTDAKLQESVAKMIPVMDKPATPATPAAVSELTAAVQTLTQKLRRTSSEVAQAGVPAAKNTAAIRQSDPMAALGPTTAADNLSFNSATRGDLILDRAAFAQAGLSAKSGQQSRSADADAALLQSTAGKAEVQFMTNLETAAADSSHVVVPGSAGSMVSASTEPAANSAAAVTVRAFLAPEVGSQGWDKALSQQMANMGKVGHQITELQLNPPGLGPLKVTLDLNDHQMQLTFVSNHASVRAAVEAAMPQLRATLAENGISLGNSSVNAESQPQTQSAFAQGQGQGRASDHRAYPNRLLPDNAAPLAQAVTAARLQGGGLAVDTYA